MLKATPVDKRDFVLVDLRRNDFEVSMQEIRGLGEEGCCWGFSSMISMKRSEDTSLASLTSVLGLHTASFDG